MCAPIGLLQGENYLQALPTDISGVISSYIAFDDLSMEALEALKLLDRRLGPMAQSKILENEAWIRTEFNRVLQARTETSQIDQKIRALIDKKPQLRDAILRRAKLDGMDIRTL